MNERKVYATCIREQVEPLEAALEKRAKVLEEAYETMQAYREEIDEKASENAKLRALVQELRSAGDKMKESIGQIAYELEEGMPLTDTSSCITEAERVANEWSAKEAGFVPTNTQDNG